MSRYVEMDHAGWVQKHLDAVRQHKPTAAQRRAASESKGDFAAPEQLNAFHKRAFDILGIVGGGIYNAPISWGAVYWAPRQIIVPWRFNNVFGTFDFSGLTVFVFLCHEARIRGYLESGAPGGLKIWLSERSHEGGVSQRHPSLDEALADFRRWFPVDHPTTYSAADAAPNAELAK